MLGKKVRWLAVFVVLGACSKGESRAPKRPMRGGTVRCEVASVQKENVPIYLFGVGTAQALYTARVHSQVDGRITHVHFNEGSTIERGAPLVELDTRPFEIALAQAESNLTRDLALMNNNRLNRDRNRTLLGTGLVSKGTVTDAEALADEGAATVAADRAQVANAKLQLEYARVRAPISGRTGVRLIDPGNVVHASDANALVVITQMDPIAVISTVPESALTRVQTAMRKGSVRVDALTANGEAVLCSGTLNLIDNLIDPATGTLRLKSTFENRESTLWPGQFVRTRFLLDTLIDALMIPEQAVLLGDDGPFVFVIGPEHKAVVRPVEVRERTDGKVRIASGLTADDRVVIEGQYRLHAGTIVAWNDDA